MPRPIRATLVVAVALVTMLTGVLGRAAPAARASSPTGYTTLTGSGPISQINVGVDTTLQAVDRRVSRAGEFFPVGTNCTADFGVFVTIGSTLYGPSPASAWHCAGSKWNMLVMKYTPVSQTVSGSGTSTAPFTVVTVVRLNPFITLTQTVSFVAGNTYFSETNTLSNSNTGPAVSAKIFNVAEPDPGSIDVANGYHDSVSVGASNPVAPVNPFPPPTITAVQCIAAGGTVNAGVCTISPIPAGGCPAGFTTNPGPHTCTELIGTTTNPNPFPTAAPFVYPCTSTTPSIYQYFVLLKQITPWTRSMVNQYQTVYNQLSAGSLTGPDDLVCNSTTPLDPAVAVEWDVAVGTGSSVSVSKTVSFTSTLPTFQPGRIQGFVSCNSISAPFVTCSPVPAGNGCPACGSNLHFVIPVICNGIALDLQNTQCAGAIGGHLGFPNFIISVRSGGITPLPHGGGIATLFGQGTYFSSSASFALQGIDDDVTGNDTIKLSIVGFRGVTHYTWTCSGTPCLEIFP